MNEERKQILQMLDDGKITVDEALKLLEAIEGPKKDAQEPVSKSEGTEISTYISEDSTYREEERKFEKRQSFKDKFTEFIDSALQKIKDVDFDFNFGPYQEVNHIFQHRDVILSHIHVDISNGSLTIIPWKEQDVRIECKAKVYRHESFEGAKTYFLKNTRFFIDGESMRFSVEPKQLKLKTVIYIPDVLYDKIQLRLFNGHVDGKQLRVSKLKVNTANGNIEFADIDGKDFELETANGHIKIEGGRAQEIEAETINGQIDVTGSFEKVDLQTFSSNINCKLTDASGKFVVLNTTTGNIDLTLPNTIEVKGKVKSNIGGFACDLSDLEIIDEKKDMIQKEMHFAANKGQINKLYVEASSTTGSIVVKNEEN
ncbi:DUF4097 family beta strand repeat-containing protein [Calidifontibacillus erzurumensis]|uniref:DUF4097 family beta strand repeat-containing protein n=1 Tax=Calidifontibacillus erzurumensis TaxID=2741433 RepID=UPI0035B51DD8